MGHPGRASGARSTSASTRTRWRFARSRVSRRTPSVRESLRTGSRVGDGPMLPEPLARIPPEEPIGLVTADGAYDTRPCHPALSRGPVTRPSPLVRPARSSGIRSPGSDPDPPHSPPGATDDLGRPRQAPRPATSASRATRRLGQAIWRTWSGYHRRRRLKAKMRCLKLLGERLMARDFDRQTTELHIRAALLNRFTRLGTPETRRVA